MVVALPKQVFSSSIVIVKLTRKLFFNFRGIFDVGLALPDRALRDRKVRQRLLPDFLRRRVEGSEANRQNVEPLSQMAFSSFRRRKRL